MSGELTPVMVSPMMGWGPSGGNYSSNPGLIQVETDARIRQEKWDLEKEDIIEKRKAAKEAAEKEAEKKKKPKGALSGYGPLIDKIMIVSIWAAPAFFIEAAIFSFIFKAVKNMLPF
jgi:hypothetical protein